MIQRIFPFWGAEDEGTEEAQETPETPEETEVREVTAKEIEKMTARAADRSARKARKELAEELGFGDLNQFKDWVQSQREAEKQEMDEREKAITEAQEAKAEAEALRHNLASERLGLAIDRQVIGSGVTDEKKVQRIAALVRLDLDADLINEEQVWEEAITEALASVKEDAPELFGVTQNSGFGSGDGGARGRSTSEPDLEAERRKKLEDEFANRGLVPYDA